MFGGDEVGAVIEELDAVNADVARAQRQFLRLVARLDRVPEWRFDGARDLAHWLSMRYGVASWKARRWVAAAVALEELPAVDDAFTSGSLGIDKTVELTRFAATDDEARLVRWAREVSCATVRRRADRARRAHADEVVSDERSRSLTWWWIEEGRRLGLAGEFPAAQGAQIVRAIERTAACVPAMPGEEGEWFAEARRADALAALCSASLAADPDTDRATVVLHARVDPAGMFEDAEIEGATAVPRSTAERLVCDARVQVVLEDARGEAIGIGRSSREPTAWMLRQLRYRDRGCRFPGCGTSAFAQAHHIAWWSRGGRTDLDNLLLICSFHHRLVHEYGWGIRCSSDGDVDWITPDGERYRPGPRAPALVGA